MGGWYGFAVNWFYPATMVLLGAHYLPFVFLYWMRMVAVLAALLVGGGLVIVMYWSRSFSCRRVVHGPDASSVSGPWGEPLRNMSVATGPPHTLKLTRPTRSFSKRQ